MTGEEAIITLKVVDENATCDDCLYYNSMEDCPNDEDCIIRQAIDMAIKALEQRIYIVEAKAGDVEELLKNIDKCGAIISTNHTTIKPIYVEVLDKIRAEIVDLGQRTMNDNRASGIWACRDIIDKYRGESEG